MEWKPRSTGVKRERDKLKGVEQWLDENKKLWGYCASPGTAGGKHMGIIVVHDVYGFSHPNCKYAADYLASKGSQVVMPDCFSCMENLSAWRATESETTVPTGDADFQAWFGMVTSESYWQKFHLRLDETIAFLKTKGCKRFGIMGFCWGGLAAEMAAKTGKFTAAVSTHGCMHNDESYRTVKCKMLYITVNNDVLFPKEQQDKITAAGGMVKVFEGMEHGFVVRGDFAKKSAVKQAADEAMEAAERLFTSVCIRDCTYTKVASLNTFSTGVTCVAKILSEPALVAAQSRTGEQFYEVTIGDETAQFIMSLRDTHLDGLSIGRAVCIRKASVKMIGGFMRLIIDRGTKIDFDVEQQIDSVGSLNISKIEHELTVP